MVSVNSMQCSELEIRMLEVCTVLKRTKNKIKVEKEREGK